MNLKSELTVFLISTNEGTRKDCLDSLNNQTTKFNFDEIKNVFPMSKAFTEMHVRCKTKFFIQVDSDMVLNEDAIEKLYFKAKKSFFNTYRISAPLYEIGFGKGGTIKCWKKYIFKFFDFKDVRTVDRDFEKRVRKFGFIKQNLNEIVGNHIPRHSNISSFIKSKADVEKWKFLKRKFHKYCGPKLNELTNKNRNIYELYGLLLGVISPKENVLKSKNLYLENIKFNLLDNLFNFESVNNDQIFKMVNENINHISEVYSDFSFKEETKKKKLIELIANSSIYRDNVEKQKILDILNK